MKKDIVRFIQRAKERYGFEAIYYPKHDTYFLHMHGRAIQGFTSRSFYEIPKRRRMFEFMPLIKVGMHRNLGEDKSLNQVQVNTKIGKIIR